MRTDLATMSLSELKELSREVAKAMETFEDRRRREALAALEEHARKFGYTVAELTGSKVMKTRSPARPKYANPSNPSETWSGRGRKPAWFAAALAAGKTAQDLSL